MAGDDNMRIGDAERERAVSRLQEHHAAGRLSTDEFNDRMGKALEARTGSDLRGLFVDLPGGDTRYEPGQPPTYGASPYSTPLGPYDDPYGLQDSSLGMSSEPAPYYAQPASSEVDETNGHFAKPWYAQWWILIVAIFVSGIADGRLWFLVPAAAIWIWVVYPNLHRRQQPPPQVSAPPRPMTYLERDEVILALQTGGEVAAIRRYREMTGADLYTATQTVRAINRELGA